MSRFWNKTHHRGLAASFKWQLLLAMGSCLLLFVVAAQSLQTQLGATLSLLVPRAYSAPQLRMPSVSPQVAPVTVTHPITVITTASKLVSVRPAKATQCTPAAAASTLPSKVDLSSAPDGLSQVIDPTLYYHIYGSTNEQIVGQIMRCAPSGGLSAAEFSGETNYQINWLYSYSNIGGNLCSIMNAKIGLHVNMVLPDWQPDPQADPQLSSAWQAFENGLAIHEQGHVEISKYYANLMLEELKEFPAQSCGGLETTVNSRLNADLGALENANKAYDESTNHGATQGAVLP